jgi:hypothetical protein
MSAIAIVPGALRFFEGRAQLLMRLESKKPDRDDRAFCWES